MSQATSGSLLAFGCWGWILTVPVLTTETDLMGPVAVEPEPPMVGAVTARSAVTSSGDSQRVELPHVVTRSHGRSSSEATCEGRTTRK
jgi:hypothetical protein